MYASHRVFVVSLNTDKAIFLNTLTGHCLILPDDYYQLFRRVEISDPTLKIEEYSKQTAFLKKNHYFFESPEAEQEFFNQRYQSELAKIKSQLIHFTLVPNHLCNYDCAYCFEPREQRSKNTAMSDEMVAAAFSTIDELCSTMDFSHSKKPVVHLMGGETLLLHMKPQIALILENLYKRDFKTEIITNAHYLEEYSDLLLRYKSTVAAIQVTLDGVEEVHNKRRVLKSTGVGNFKKIVKGVDIALEHGIPIKLRMNLDATNKDISGFVDFVKQKGWLDNPVFNLLPGLVDDQNECGDYNELLNEQEMYDVVEPISDMTCEKSGDKPIIAFGMLHKIRDYLKIRSKKNFSMQDCMINQSYVLAPTGKLYQCAVTMHKQEHAIGSFFPKFEMNKSTKRFGWEKIEDAREEKGCMTCSTAAVCPGPCPINAKKSYNQDKEKYNGSCIEPQDPILEYIEHYKEEILKLPILELK